MANKHLLYFQIFRKAYFARVPLLKIFLKKISQNFNPKKASVYESLLKHNFSIYERDELFKITKDFIKSTKKINNQYQIEDDLAANEQVKNLNLKLKAAKQNLAKIGWHDMTCNLTVDIANELNDLSKSKEDEINPILTSKIPKKTYDFEPKDLIELPSVKLLLESHELNKFIENSVGLPVKIKFFQGFWSFPVDNAKGSQLWHRDRDDLREMKMFIYCNSVDENTGPHAFLPFSHNYNFNKFAEAKLHKADRLLISDQSRTRFDDSKIKLLYPDVEIKLFTGPRGTAFLENTHGLHRGYPPVNKPRLMFAICWCVGLDYFKNPPQYVTKSQEAIKKYLKVTQT